MGVVRVVAVLVFLVTVMTYTIGVRNTVVATQSIGHVVGWVSLEHYTMVAGDSIIATIVGTVGPPIGTAAGLVLLTDGSAYLMLSGVGSYRIISLVKRTYRGHFPNPPSNVVAGFRGSWRPPSYPHSQV